MPVWELPGGDGIPAQNGLPVMRSALIDTPFHDPKFGLRTFDPLMEDPVFPMQVACNGHIAVPGSRLFQDHPELEIMGLKQRLTAV